MSDDSEPGDAGLDDWRQLPAGRRALLTLAVAVHIVVLLVELAVFAWLLAVVTRIDSMAGGMLTALISWPYADAVADQDNDARAWFVRTIRQWRTNR